MWPRSRTTLGWTAGRQSDRLSQRRRRLYEIPNRRGIMTGADQGQVTLGKVHPPVPDPRFLPKMQRKLRAFQQAIRCTAIPWLLARGKKPMTVQMAEVYDILRVYRRWPGYYFRFRGYLKEPDRAGQLVSPRLLNKVQFDLNRNADLQLVGDKRRFRIWMQELGYPVIQEFFSKYGPGTIVDGQGVLVPLEQVAAFLKQRKGDLFVKPLGSSLGLGAFVWKPGDSSGFLENESTWIIQERLKQHPDMNRLYPGALNTLRILTVKHAGQIHVEMLVLRIGSGGSCIDNSGAGGLSARVDPDTGRIATPATRRYEFDPSQRPYREHPDTGVTIEGFEIPFFRDGLEIVVDAASKISSFRSLGWDVCFMEDGPLIVEANAQASVDLFLRFCDVANTATGRMARETYARRGG
ncbi:MAG: hypothetical protein KKB66_20030 [Alphaproteobacteria bacterium]|nr:hypothetical protein [Alphaproteobacteria bacterium]MBU0803898.1 hypothetical protein [Alphaproteobacteria bacterium]MBU0872805.1 hypothetical protein [Alphaproteobacteria bacterium]MBU1402825.1 hypothetical protein [Alphaproteobacteria bacterium]MBU1593467.1 hypothetical protein [Alphaproteobacteria bacterium]